MKVAKVIILQIISYPLCSSFGISSYTASFRHATSATPLYAAMDVETDESSSLGDKLNDILDRIDAHEKKAAAAIEADAEATFGVKPSKPLEVKPIFIKHLPPKEMTGMDPFYAQLCATISRDLYNTESKVDEFYLDQGFELDRVGLKQAPEVILYDINGISEACNPPFAVVVAGTTMILGWRGSVTAMYWDRDFGFFTSSSFRWKNVAKMVKVQGPYMALVENCMIEHEDFILNEIKSRGITELILTGHSLGGGVAQVAHLWFEGSMTQSGTDNNDPWKELA